MDLPHEFGSGDYPPPPHMSLHAHRRFIERERVGLPPRGNNNGFEPSQTPPKKAPKDEDTLEMLDRASKSSSAGMTLDCKTVYSGKEDDRGRFVWLDEKPDDLVKPAESGDSTNYALVVRRKRVFGDPRKTLTLHSIAIQSPLQRKLLVTVLKGYPGVTVELKRLEFHEPFAPFIHRWERLKQAVKSEEDEEAKKHGKLLYDMLHEELNEPISVSTDMKTNRVANFDLLWTLFPPGCTIYTRQEGHETALRMSDGHYSKNKEGEDIYVMNGQQIDDDGSRFGRRRTCITIKTFSGTVPITSLEAYPISFHPDNEDLMKRLQRRGAQFESLAGVHYKYYKGVGWKLGLKGNIELHNVNGRVVIDSEGWNYFTPARHISLKPLGPDEDLGIGENAPLKVDEEGEHGSGEESEEDEDPDEGPKDAFPMDGRLPESGKNKTARDPLTANQHVLCSPTVRGFAFDEKVWLNLFVNCVSDIEFSPTAFDTLVLPENQKELILGFTQSQQITSSSESPIFDDVIAGKGKGIVLLLSGPPGVGKTLTAESVAENMQAPLYQMSAAELGMHSEEIDIRLREILELCRRWSAVLLLDEAEVFLAERNLHELERNRLVAVFLRALEYYQGIMFLTTNRVRDFDPAFQSRIHISLEYPDLNADSRRSVWASFLGPKGITAQQLGNENQKENQKDGKDQAQMTASNGEATSPMTNDSTAAPQSATAKDLPTYTKPVVIPSSSKHTNTATAHSQDHKNKPTEPQKNVSTLPSSITDGDLDKLSLIELNGRQIKNAAKAAKLLAFHRGVDLRLEHVMTVLDVTQHLHKASRDNERQRSAIFM
ncbi:MAG: hypothetical protein M1831_005699 [Alyxoria varia]|nr:MAG: hypothetical protein M1831_005699 [Alyxoria varia]